MVNTRCLSLGLAFCPSSGWLLPESPPQMFLGSQSGLPFCFSGGRFCKAALQKWLLVLDAALLIGVNKNKSWNVRIYIYIYIYIYIITQWTNQACMLFKACVFAKIASRTKEKHLAKQKHEIHQIGPPLCLHCVLRHLRQARFPNKWSQGQCSPRP